MSRQKRTQARKEPSFPVHGGGGQPTLGEISGAISGVSDNAKAWASGAVQRIGKWIQGAAAGAPARARGPGA